MASQPVSNWSPSGEFAATTSITMIREIPMAPGTQFFKYTQSRRGPHRRMLNSSHFKRGHLMRGRSDYTRISAEIHLKWRFRELRLLRRNGFKAADCSTGIGGPASLRPVTSAGVCKLYRL